jgi:hypothetical protein
MMTIGIKDVKSKRPPILDDFSIIKSYKNVFTLRANDYKHLVINFYLAHRDFDIRSSSNDYLEVFQINLPNNLLLISTEDAQLQPGFFATPEENHY